MFGWLQAFLVLFAVSALNFSLSFHNVWPTPWIQLRPELSVEMSAILLLLAVRRTWFGGTQVRAQQIMAITFVILALGRYAQRDDGNSKPDRADPAQPCGFRGDQGVLCHKRSERRARFPLTTINQALSGARRLMRPSVAPFTTPRISVEWPVPDVSFTMFT